MKNTPIRIISSNFELLGEIDDYESLIFIRRFYKVGEFELHININKNNVDMLQEDNLIILGNNTKKVGVIRHKEIQLNEHGEATETLIVKGYTLKGILGRRIIIPSTGQGYDNAVGSQEQIMKQFVYNNVVNPSDINRRIPQLVIALNQNRGKQDKWRGRFEKLTDKLQEIGEYAELGWDITLDIENNKWIFDVIQGKNLTSNQEALPPVIFSVDFDNIKGQTYIDSSLNYSNVGYAGGKGEAEERLIQQIGEVSGFDRIESFLDCSNAENILQLQEEGNKKLEEFKKIKTFESQVIDFGSFVYMQDWDVGDLVTVQNRKWNLTMDARIVEVKEIYEVNGFQLECTFGNNIPTIIDKIKKLEQQKLIEAKTGISGTTGKNGETGKSIEFAWNGTELGIKQEGQEEYKYVNLQGKPGPKGEQGIQGLPGTDGKSLEFKWNGTKLGIRVEGQNDYIYVDLKGEKGEPGIPGPKGDDGYTPIKGIDYFDGGKGEKGDTGSTGPQGRSIEYIWNGTKLGVRTEGETNYNFVDLIGPKGDIGPPGKDGKDGIDASDKPATKYSLGGIKVGANLKITEDGTLSANNNPSCISIKQEVFTVGENQTIFYLKKGSYTPHTNSIFWYIEGNKQTNEVLEELTSSSFSINGGLESGTEILVEYIETVNVTIGLKGDRGEPGPQGIQGPKGEKGDAGPQGIPGTDANITKKSIIDALGYTPANDTKIGGGINIICSNIEPPLKEGEWWYKE